MPPLILSQSSGLMVYEIPEIIGSFVKSRHATLYEILNSAGVDKCGQIFMAIVCSMSSCQVRKRISSDP